MIVLMVLYYVVAGWRVHAAFLVVTILLHLAAQVFFLLLGHIDPGFVPKILGDYERQEYKKIPISQDYTSGSIRDYQKVFIMGIKTHCLKVKFCSTCYIFRPPRTSHCYDCNMCV